LPEVIATSANTGPNAAQIENWDGPGGQHWVAEAERYDRMTGAFGERIIEAAAPRPGERVLDVGCGNGAVALAVSALVAPGGSVLGLDISGPMLGCARQRADAAGIASVSFRQGDAQVYPLPTASFDAVVSRFGVMFFDDPVAAFTNLGRALRPGGRIAFTCWRELAVNDWLMVPAGAALQHVPMPDLGQPGAPGPFSLADPERVHQVLRDAAFAQIALEEVVRPMPMGSSAEDVLAFMRGTEMAQVLMTGVDPGTAEQAWAAVKAALQAHAEPGGITLAGTAWIVTARRAG
jgi:SAM-dependent methyltransferase